jgi:serine/threonine protein kinase
MELPKPSRRNTAVGSYVLGEEIGKGAHGQVYKAIDTTDGSMVAVKEIALKRLDDRAREALRLEIDLLTELGAHENVIALKGVVEHDEYVYVVLELAENGSLASLVKPNKFGCLSERLAKVYVTQLLKGLAFLHKKGVVHRDVKGANVLTTKDGVVKIADFGVALRRARDEDDEDDDDETANENGMNATSSDLDVQGTPYWMAPEAIEMRQDEKKVGFASDVWSVGCVVVELLTGAPPYFDMQPMPAMFAIVNNKRPPLPEGISEDLRDFLKKCFQRDPRKRPTARDALLHRWIVARREERTTHRDDESKKKKALKVTSSTSPPPRHYDSEKRHASDASSDDDDSEEEPEWSAPKEMGASSRRRRIVPPSSPFQDAPILDGSDGATPAVNDRGSSLTTRRF